MEKSNLPEVQTSQVQVQKTATQQLTPVEQIKKIIRNSESVFISQIAKPELEARVLFKQESAFAMQIINNMEEKARDYFIQCWQKNPDSLQFAIANVAASGLSLNPALKQAYLVPRQGKIIFEPSYMGKKEKAIETGLVLNIWAELVYEKDFFVYEGGTKKIIEHKPDFFSDRGTLKGGYAVAKMTNGELEICIMPIAELDSVRKRSQMANMGAWNSDTNEMYKKTLINRIFKMLPKKAISTELLSILQAENEEQTNLLQIPEKTKETDFFND